MRLKLILSFLFPLFAGTAEATCHLYFMPMIGSGTPVTDPRRPKYTIPGTFSGMHFGGQAIYLIATDISDPDDATLTANADVTKIPDALDNQIGGALATIQTALENRNIPADWLTSVTTYRSALQTIIGVFKFFQRFMGVTGINVALINGSTITLDTQFQSLSALNRQRLLDTATALSFDTSGFTGTSTMRQILKGVADQFGNTTVQLGCMTI